MSFNVAVQPPSQVQAGTVLYPPLVVSSDSGADYDFVQVSLLDPYGRVLENSLWGTLSMSKQPLDGGNSSSSGGPKDYAVFPDLAVTSPGTYSLQVTAIRMDYNSPDGPAAVIASSITTREIYAYEGSVASENPSSDERSLLRRLRRHGGFGVPRDPRR